MKLPKNAVVAVADGEILKIFVTLETNTRRSLKRFPTRTFHLKIRAQAGGMAAVPPIRTPVSNLRMALRLA